MRKKINNETSYVIDKYASGCDSNLILQLKELLEKSSRRRHRFCFHQNPNVDLHDIIITYDQATYIPPNKHIGKDETLCILEGIAKIYYFNDVGHCYGHHILSSESEDLPCIVRIPSNTWHGVQVLSKNPVIIKETISGPYSKSSLLWADFAPSEAQNLIDKSGYAFYESIAETTTDLTIEDNYMPLSANVLLSTNQHPTFSLNNIGKLEQLAKDSPLKRSRICLHRHNSNHLQDMIIYLSAGTEIDISYHINKDESLMVLKGKGRYMFFNNDLSIAEEHTLSPYMEMSGDARCFERINRFIPHKIQVIEDMLIYETTSGPFSPSDTAYKINLV